MPMYKLNILNKEVDLDWMTRSNKGVVLRDNEYKRRLESAWDFEMYKKINMNTAEDEKVLYNTTTEIFNLYDVLMKPFMARSLAEIRQNFKSPDVNKVKEALLEAKFILRDLIGVSNINIVYNLNESVSPNKKNIAFFIDRLYTSIDDFKISNPLDFEYVKGGFYMFKNPEKVMITIVISADVLYEILNNRVTVAEAAASDGVYGTDLNLISFSDSKLKVSLSELRREFAKAFISDFRFALYKEAYRESVTCKLLWYYRMYLSVANQLDTLNLAKDLEDDKMLSLIYDSVENFVNCEGGEDKDITQDTNGFLQGVFSNQYSEVHPLRLMSVVSQVEHERSVSFLRQLAMPHLNNHNLINVTSGSWIYSFEDCGDHVTNNIIRSIAYKRLLPWSILSISLSTYRSRKLKLTEFIKNTNEELIPILQTLDTYYNSTTIAAIIPEIALYEEISMKMGNPLVEKILTEWSFKRACREYAKQKNQSEQAINDAEEGDVEDGNTI